MSSLDKEILYFLKPMCYTVTQRADSFSIKPMFYPVTQRSDFFPSNLCVTQRSDSFLFHTSSCKLGSYYYIRNKNVEQL